MEMRNRGPKGYRASHETPWCLSRYAYDDTNGDFLLFWYFQVFRDGEHAQLWGEVGLSPLRFLATFMHVPLLVAYQEGADWLKGQGLLFAVWGDDWIDGVRARLHFWAAPQARTLRVLLPIGQEVLRTCFEDLGLQLLEGRTPTDNAGALRFIARLGFRQVHRLDHGEWQWNADGTKQIIPVIQSQLLVEHWRAHA
jgi:Acetyltransferases, including N-acetylases of ribosomal proteins